MIVHDVLAWYQELKGVPDLFFTFRHRHTFKYIDFSAWKKDPGKYTKIPDPKTPKFHDFYSLFGPCIGQTQFSSKFRIRP